MSSGFLLLETVPGREGQVLEKLSRLPGVIQGSVLFPAAVAVKIDTGLEAFDPLALQLKRLEGVVATRVYRARNA